jgi:hypothetical protein
MNKPEAPPNIIVRNGGVGRGCAVLLLILTATLSIAAASVRRPSWEDTDNDGRSTRQQILEWTCQVELGPRGGIIEAKCLDGYGGEAIETKRVSEDIEINHLYPWSVAAQRGAFADRKLAREAFYGDMDNLVVTSAKTNNDKRDKMPREWCPPSPLGRKSAAARIRRVVDRHGLPLLTAEELAVKAWEAGECGIPGQP